MQVWEQQLEQMRTQVWQYASDWDELVEMVAEADSPEEAKRLHDYLEYLVPRIRNMQRRFNWVEYKDGWYRIHNYTYAMYKWFVAQKFAVSRITPSTLFIISDELSPKQREKIHKMLEP